MSVLSLLLFWIPKGWYGKMSHCALSILIIKSSSAGVFQTSVKEIQCARKKERKKERKREERQARIISIKLTKQRISHPRCLRKYEREIYVPPTAIMLSLSLSLSTELWRS